MGNIILGKVSRINIGVVESLEQVGEQTVLLNLDKALLDLEGLEEHHVYIPITLIDSMEGNNVRVYHELEQYPFFQKAKQIILADGVPKGVFRLRRILDSEKNSSVIASDLYVLSSVFGEPEKVVIKQSRSGLIPSHVIVMISFGKGTMAHVDYTLESKEFIELEWSGIGQIIEFNSEEMNPLNPVVNTQLTLQYQVESILESSKSIRSVRKELQRFQQLVGGVDE